MDIGDAERVCTKGQGGLVAVLVQDGELQLAAPAGLSATLRAAVPTFRAARLGFVVNTMRERRSGTKMRLLSSNRDAHVKREWTAMARISWLGCMGALLHASSMAQVGLAPMKVPGGPLEPATTSVALYYPTAAPAKPVTMGPFTVTGALQAEPTATVKGLIVLSHGTGGTERGHTSLAQALAQGGYLVAALRHPGDNWQDTSLRDGPQAGSYFSQRPRQVSNVIDAVLQDPQWKARIASDRRGPRVGALGHSAGGYTVLALAGGEADTARLGQHCAGEGATADPIFCALAKGLPTTAGAAPAASPTSADARVRAVAALAPLGAVFTARSLARITVPTLLYEAEGDRFLVPRFHSGWVAQNMPNIERVAVPKAWHFAFMDTPSMPLPSPDGLIGADPPGFDRARFLEDLGRALTAFFDRNLQ